MKRPNHLRAVPSSDFHPVDCACPTCEPYAPSRPRFAAALTRTSMQLLLGIIAGTLLMFAYAGVRPTLAAFFGW